MADETGVLEQPEAEAPENAVEENAAEVAAPAEPTLDPLELQAEIDHMRSQNEELYGIIQQALSGQQQPQQGQQAAPDYSQLVDEYGNFNAQAFAELQRTNNEALLGQIAGMFTPIQQTFAQQQESSVIAEGEARLNDILADDVSRNGEFASDPEADAQARELVSTLASQMFPDIADRYGSNPKAAEIAMTRAATQVRGLLRSVGGAAVTQNQNTLATLAGAHGEPGAHGAGVEAPVIRMGDTSAARFASGGN